MDLTSLRLKDRIAVITGAGSGIGRAMALHFAKEGANIVIADLNLESAQETAKSIEALQKKTLALKVDISNLDDVQNLVNKTYEAFERVDILVNNAGIFPLGYPLIKLPEDIFDQCVAVNLRGTFLCSKYFGQKMTRQKNIPESNLRGKIVNISSMAGKEGWPLASVYCATKFGVIGLTQAMAKEVAPRVTVNAICPGLIKTPLWGPAEDRLNEVAETMKVTMYMKRFGMPEDVTPLAVFLASSDSDYITGETFDVSGGIIFR
jgi:NAD(P)-dependent dehydrogenase (short-subunit alcohol dehydrogenase family)